jgi:hypothetical protein
MQTRVGRLLASTQNLTQNSFIKQVQIPTVCYEKILTVLFQDIKDFEIMMEPPVSNSTSHNPCSELGQKLQTNSAKANSNTASVSEIAGVSSNCGSEANAGVYIETMLKRAHKFFSKLDNQMLESGPVSLDRQETMGAGYAICRLAKTNKELFLDREENAGHHQVTAVQKIRVALRPTKLDKAALILDKDEFQALADLFDKSNRDKALVRDPNSPRLVGIIFKD